MKLIKAENTTKPWWILETVYAERSYPKKAGFWWNTRVCPNVWATNDLEKAYLVREHASPELKAELERDFGARVKKVNASKAADADIDIPRPDGLEYMPFQKAGIAYALDRPATLFGDEMGLGKTIQALGVCNATDPADVLVICPASLRLNWLREAQKWLVKDREYYVVDSPQPIPKTANFVICNYERLGVPGLLDRNWDLLVLDEAHKVKNPKAKRTQRVVGIPPNKKKQEERVPGLVDRVKRKLFLTGTPILNRPVELFPLLSALEPEGLGKSFWYFAKRYCAASKGEYGWDFSGSSHLDELQIRLRESIMVRRLKMDVLTELPAKRRQLVALAPNGAVKIVREEQEAWEAQEEALAQARAEVDMAWASGDEDAYKAAVAALTRATRVAFGEISAMRHRVALAKVPHFLEYAQDALESTDKVIIFAHHRDVIKQLFEGLGAYGPVRITGEDPTDARDAAVERFQNDPTCRVIIGSIGAMGVGLTLTASSTVLFAELSWVPAEVTQAEDRAHRIGQQNAVSVVHVVLDGSLDQRMADILISKQEVADRALDKGADRRVDLDMQTPTIPTVTASKPQQVPEYSDATKERVLEALQYLRACCDGAFRLDGVGFSKIDVALGHSLASLTSLSNKQGWLGLKLCNKYRRQLQGRDELLEEAEAQWGKKKKEKKS